MKNGMIATNFEFSSGLFAGRNTDQVFPILKAIAHPLRLMIVCSIAEKEASVQELANSFDTTQSNLSQHLAVLKNKGVVTSRRVDNYSMYRVICPEILQIIGK